MNQRTIAGISLILGGSLWIVKSVLILCGRGQPDVIFEIAPFFLTLGVYLSIRLDLADQLLTLLGLPAILLTLLAAVVFLVAGDTDLFGGLLGLGMLLLLATMVHGGLQIWKVGGWSSRSSLPLVIALSFVPMIIIGGILESIEEKLLEVPLLIVALLWLVYGWTTLRGRVPERRGSEE